MTDERTIAASLAEFERHIDGLAQLEVQADGVPTESLDHMGHGFLRLALVYLSSRRGRGMGVAMAKRAADEWKLGR